MFVKGDKRSILNKIKEKKTRRLIQLIFKIIVLNFENILINLQVIVTVLRTHMSAGTNLYLREAYPIINVKQQNSHKQNILLNRRRPT